MGVCLRRAQQFGQMSPKGVDGCRHMTNHQAEEVHRSLCFLCVLGWSLSIQSALGHLKINNVHVIFTCHFNKVRQFILNIIFLVNEMLLCSQVYINKKYLSHIWWFGLNWSISIKLNKCHDPCLVNL